MLAESVLKEAVYHENIICMTSAKRPERSVVMARLSPSTVESKAIYQRRLKLDHKKGR